MIVHCLGTTGYHPSPTRHTACYYLPEQSLVLDAGTGFFRITEHLLNDPHESLDIFLSHAHLDHIFGLTFLLDTLAVTTLKRVRVLGLGVKLDAVRVHLFSEHLFPVWPTIELQPIDDLRQPLRLAGNTSMTWFPVEHPGGAIGVRLDSPEGGMAYVTDTIAKPNARYQTHLRNLKLLLHECYFNDDQQALAEKTGHSWLSAVAHLVDEIRPEQTALIHINPLAELMRIPLHITQEHCDLGMVVAEDGMTFRF